MHIKLARPPWADRLGPFGEVSAVIVSASEMQPKPLVYILHGAWHGPEYFEAVGAKLQALGYTMLCPRQPSTGASPPDKTLYDDAAIVRAELEVLIEHGQDVLLVMHSYGGMVGTQAAAGLGREERSKQGKKGGIVKLLYACSFMLPLGADLCNALGGSFPPWIIEEVSGDRGLTVCWKVVLTVMAFRRMAAATQLEPNSGSTTTYHMLSKLRGRQS
jgi:pimeloyl-ACP methyl ester carboxylesterase